MYSRDCNQNTQTERLPSRHWCVWAKLQEVGHESSPAALKAVSKTGSISKTSRNLSCKPSKAWKHSMKRTNKQGSNNHQDGNTCYAEMHIHVQLWHAVRKQHNPYVLRCCCLVARSDGSALDSAWSTFSLCPPALCILCTNTHIPYMHTNNIICFLLSDFTEVYSSFCNHTVLMSPCSLQATVPAAWSARSRKALPVTA